MLYFVYNCGVVLLSSLQLHIVLENHINVYVFSLAAPSGPPQNMTPTIVFSTNITLQWGRVGCIHRNSEISHYILHYSLVVNESDMDQRDVSVQGVGDEDRMHTITRLHPLSTYNVTIAAVNVNEEKGPVSNITVTTNSPESE